MGKTVPGSLPNTAILRHFQTHFKGLGGWDKGTWGLGVGLGDYPNTIQGSLPNTRLGFGWLGQGNLGFRVGLGDYPLGYHSFTSATLALC